ncbi:UNVERIFIED_CONTAM: hypothetical protein Sindi_2020900 [Sesamum indicum]
MDFRYLRPWAQHVLTNEEAAHLLEPFTADDVKNVVFDIAEDKAPGLDGFSSDFYKVAWLVVGHEVTNAILDFFTTGKLLKQINSTLLALIPKVHSPMSVVDFRPISCCNVLYKIIAKLIVQRLSPAATEMCIESDTRKAYDTVEWDFLLLVLHMGLLELIEQDMQFTFHWKCEASRFFQLGFVDDLILYSRANIDSIRVLKDELDQFATWSGLRLNVNKSHLIISSSAQNMKDELLLVLGFQEGHLPMRYLGLPLISSRLSIFDYQPLLTKIDTRINGWEGLALSYAVGVQIIKSVLMALSVYWAFAFILRKGVIKDIEKRLRAFLWKGTGTSGYAKVAWKEVCKEKEEGGLGLRDIDTLNHALMFRKLCDIIRCDRTSIWVEWLYHGRLRDTFVWTVIDRGG